MTRNGLRVAATAFAAVVLTGTTGGCTGRHSENKDPVQMAQAAIKDEWDAAVAEDADRYRELSSSAFRLQRADGSGSWRDEYADGLRDPAAYDLSSYEISDVAAKRDGDVLVTTYTVIMKLTKDGKSFPDKPTRFMTTFVRRDGKWLAASEANFGKFNP